MSTPTPSAPTRPPYQVCFLGESAYVRWPLALKLHRESCTEEEMERPETGDYPMVRELLIDDKPYRVVFMWYWSSDRFTEQYWQHRQIMARTCAAIVIYRVDMARSFVPVKQYMDDIVNRSRAKDIPKILVGYGRDNIAVGRQVSREEGEAIAREYSCLFFEVSLDKGEDIENLLVTIWRTAQEYDLLKRPPVISQAPPPAPPPEPKKKSCDVQ